MTRLRFLLAGTGAALAISIACAPAAADEPAPPATESSIEDRSALGFLIGGATAAIPFAVGASITTTTSQQTLQNGAVITMQSGLAIAPFLSHAIVGEYGRGALFSALPLAASGSMIALLQVEPSSITFASLEVQRYFYFMMVTSVVTGTIGVIDVLRAPAREKARARAASFGVTPLLLKDTYGLSFGGTL